MEMIEGLIGFFTIFIIGIIALGAYLVPSIIAICRKHHYKWVIFAINLIFGATGMGYLIALVWAVWPKETTLTDSVVKDVTTNE